MQKIINRLLNNDQIFSRIFRLKSEILWIILGQGGVICGGLFGIKLLTSTLTPYEFGRFALANTFILLISTNLFGPMGQSLMRFWSIAVERDELVDFLKVSKKIIKRFSVWTFILGAGVCLVLFFSKGWTWSILIFAAIIAGILAGWSGVRLNILMAARERKTVALANTCASFAKPVAGVLLIYLFYADAGYVLAGFIITLCVVVIVAEKCYSQKVSEVQALGDATIMEKSPAGRLGKELFAFTWPFYAWGLFGWMHQSCDRWALQAFHGADVVGAFSVITQLSVYPLVAGSTFLSTLLIPIAYQKAGGLESKDGFNTANRIILLMTGLYLFGAVSLIIVYSFFHEKVVLLISSEQYTVYSGLLPGLTTAWALYYSGQMFAGFGFLANKSVLYMAPIITSGLLATVLTFVFSSEYGVTGVVWGLGISGFVYATWFLAIVVFLTGKGKLINGQT